MDKERWHQKRARFISTRNPSKPWHIWPQISQQHGSSPLWSAAANILTPSKHPHIPEAVYTHCLAPAKIHRMAQLYSSQPAAPPTSSLCSLGSLSLLAHPACLAWNAPNTFSNFQYPIWGSGTSPERKGRLERKAAGSSLHSDTDLPPRYMLLGRKIHDKVQNASIWVKNRKEKLEILWLNTYIHTCYSVPRGSGSPGTELWGKISVVSMSLEFWTTRIYSKKLNV